MAELRLRIEEPSSQKGLLFSGETMFTDLPDSCIALIVSRLSPKDIARGACVCRRFQSTLDNDFVWEQIVPPSSTMVMERAANGARRFATKKKAFQFLCKPLQLNTGTLAYWLDQGTGGVCYSLAARGLWIVWAEDERYWAWIERQGSRWPEVAFLKEVCWFNVSGKMKCLLHPGSYTLSWRIQYETRVHGDVQFPSNHVYGWASLPTHFTLSLSDGSQASSSRRYLTNRPENAAQQNELEDLTPVRLLNDNWMEYDVGEIIVEDGEKETDIEFAMIEIDSGRWKSGVTLDGVVLRPTSLTEATGQKMTVEQLGESSLESERPPIRIDGPRGRLGGRRRVGGMFPMRRGGIRVVQDDPLPGDGAEDEG